MAKHYRINYLLNANANSLLNQIYNLSECIKLFMFAIANCGFQTIGIGNSETLNMAKACYKGFVNKHPEQLTVLFKQETY